ncbi:YopX family protein [Oceanobacillus luteolus]|uniref:YopX family protein n=1 Tax=Oceanobacillus luteolus TaxID=1274358 RepID=UPI00203DC5E5|nr:YopX family protein [Oceanobacillus luteolus]
MREIKFRAWFTDKKQMKFVAMHNVYPGNTSYFYLSPMPMSDYEPIELMQWTGLTDKNGTGIYEGDILTDHGEEGPLYVEYSNEHAAFVFVDKFDPFGVTRYTTLQISYEQFEIIGNIFEDGELLNDCVLSKAD